MKMTKEKVLAMVAEMNEEEKKTQKVPHYYKRNGEMKRRSYDDIICTPKFEELFYDRQKTGLRSEDAKIFECGCCKKKVGYFGLESWACDFEADKYICSACYERGMGDDL